MKQLYKTCLVCNHYARPNDPWCVNCGIDFTADFTVTKIPQSKIIQEISC